MRLPHWAPDVNHRFLRMSGHKARRPLPSCLFQTGRGSQYAAAPHRRLLKCHGLFGSMSRRGNPHDHAQAESFIKPRQVEPAYVGDYETFQDLVANSPKFIEDS